MTTFGVQQIIDHNPDPRLTLLQYLRDDLQLTGTKSACRSGGCGACTVMVSRFYWNDKTIRHSTLTACLLPLCSLHGCAVTTVEGIGSTREKVHPVQERLALFHGTQCGFCSPGMVMSMYTLLRNNPKPTVKEIQRALEGNLCRCTGYRPILEGFSTFSKDSPCPLGDECCQQKGPKTKKTRLQKLRPSTVCPYDPSQELIFPSELQLDQALYKRGFEVTRDGVTWFQPATLEELLNQRASHPNAKLVAGNTDRGKLKDIGKYICLNSILELQYVKLCDNMLKIGAGTSVTRLEDEMHKLKQGSGDLHSLEALLNVTRQFGGQQTRNMATIGGSLMCRKADLCTFFLAAGAICRVAQEGQPVKKIPVLDLLNSDLAEGYLLLAVIVPVPEKEVNMWYFKHSDRGTFETSVVNMAVRAKIMDNRKLISVRVVIGTGEVPVLMEEELNRLLNRNIDEGLVEEFTKCLKLPPGVTDYQRALAIASFCKWTIHITQKFDTTGVPDLSRGLISSTQVWETVSPDQPPEDAVGRDVAGYSALEHTTGEAVYVDDMLQYKGELHAALVTSSRAHARILSIDPSAALDVPGVVGFLTHKDIPGSNHFSILQSDTLFATDKVSCVGHPIGVVVAETRDKAKQASEKVQIEYEDIVPAILTTEDAVAAESFLAPANVYEIGDVDAGMTEADHVLEGEVEMGPQEHFYTEPQAALAVPGGEKNEMVVHCTTQSPDFMQRVVADVLGVPANRIVIKIKRMGGSFGGKQYQSYMVIGPASLAAMKYNKPVRCVLDQEEDMRLTGKSHGMLGRYKVGFMKEGRMHALSLTMYLNGGHTEDVSDYVANLAAKLGGNVYSVPNMRVSCRAFRTNLPSATAFRGFGTPQALFLSENVIASVASFLGLPLHQVQEMNFHKEGEMMVMGQLVEGCSLQKCWQECLENSDYIKRIKQVEQFNRKNKYQKRGIATVPILYPIGIPVPFMNQACALVHVYASDGSVLISHGGTEMGQGLNVKMIQVASRVLGIPCEKIQLSETSTSAVPNAPNTNGSRGSDVNGMAVKLACEKIIQRLEPYRSAKPDGAWEQWVGVATSLVLDAYLDSVSLSATALYTYPRINYDDTTKQGRMHEYFSYGVSCSEVQIDCLTGAHQVLRTDIVMDVGRSLNPGIDIGQIEGGFLQGYGRLMLEHLRYDHKGRLITKGPISYKIPATANVPQEFNVTLLKDGPDVGVVYSSKGIGEPPMLAAQSVFTAVKSAVGAARQETEQTGLFRLDAPAIAERIRATCGDLLSTN